MPGFPKTRLLTPYTDYGTMNPKPPEGWEGKPVRNRYGRATVSDDEHRCLPLGETPGRFDV
jgi:hypothetical protein